MKHENNHLVYKIINKLTNKPMKDIITIPQGIRTYNLYTLSKMLLEKNGINYQTYRKMSFVASINITDTGSIEIDLDESTYKLM